MEHDLQKYERIINNILGIQAKLARPIPNGKKEALRAVLEVQKRAANRVALEMQSGLMDRPSGTY